MGFVRWRIQFNPRLTCDTHRVKCQRPTGESQQILASPIPEERASDRRLGTRYKFRVQLAATSALQLKRFRSCYDGFSSHGLSPPIGHLLLLTALLPQDGRVRRSNYGLVFNLANELLQDGAWRERRVIVDAISRSGKHTCLDSAACLGRPDGEAIDSGHQLHIALIWGADCT